LAKISPALAKIKRVYNDQLRELFKQNNPTVESKSDLRAQVIEAVMRQVDDKLAGLKDGQGIGIYLRIEIVNSDWSFKGEANERHSLEAVEWRNAIFERDSYTCRECGAKGRLHAHHIIEWADSAALRFELSNGITLCVDCHAAKHPSRAKLIQKARYHKPRSPASSGKGKI
jgi:nitrate/TMAO reductase-like tetraheme cytochrome c subunit